MKTATYHGNSSPVGSWPATAYTPTVNLLTRTYFLSASVFVPNPFTGQNNPPQQVVPNIIGAGQFMHGVSYPDPTLGGSWAQAVWHTDVVADTSVIPFFQIVWTCPDIAQAGQSVGWEIHWTAHADAQPWAGGGPGSPLPDTCSSTGGIPDIQQTPSTAIGVTGPYPWTGSTIITVNVYRGTTPADTCTSAVILLGVRIMYRTLA